MPRRSPRDAAGDNPGEGRAVSAEAVAGLAREVEALRRAVRKVADLPARVDQLAETVAQAIDDLAGGRRRPDPVRPVSWIAHSTDPEATAKRLEELADWVGEVYLRYPVAARELPDCWLWHSDVVEELAWLHQAWQAAYNPDTGTVAAVGDWHDRLRPGVATRIRAAVRMCALDNHTADDRPAGVIAVPSAASTGAIARWWAAHRATQPPVPTEQDFGAAARRLDEGGRR